jgi:hypothetical protein
MKLDPNWLLILRSAYSARAMLGSAAASVVVAIQTENNYAILAAVLSLLGVFFRVTVQPVLRAQLEQANECVDKLK